MQDAVDIQRLLRVCIVPVAKGILMRGDALHERTELPCTCGGCRDFDVDPV